MGDKVQELKKQINIRGLLDPPKFGSWQNIGINEEDWNQIRAAAKENHHTDDDRNQEEDEHDKAGCKSNDEEATILPSGTYASPDLGSIQLEHRHHQQQPYSHVVSEHTVKTSEPFQPTGTSASPDRPSSSLEYGHDPLESQAINGHNM